MPFALITQKLRHPTQKKKKKMTNSKFTVIVNLIAKDLNNCADLKFLSSYCSLSLQAFVCLNLTLVSSFHSPLL